MSAVVTAIPRAAVTPRSIDEWAKVIAGDLTRAVEGIIAAGQHLQEAKAEVDHGDWLPLLKRLKMGASTAARLMRIAENKVLTNSAHWAELPSSWRTLYELTTLPPEILEAKIADGTITRETKREEVRALCSDRGDRRDRLKRVPHTALITSWDQVVKFRDIVRHNLDVKTRRYQRWGEDPEDRLNHEPTVAAMIMVSPDNVQELDRYVELHTGTSRRELMEEAVMTLCEALRRARKEHEERIERETAPKVRSGNDGKAPARSARRRGGMNEPGRPTGRSRQLWTMPCEATSAHQGHHWRHPASHPRCDPRRHMTHMRLNGELQWDRVVDKIRRRHITETYDRVDEALEACAQFYRANTGE